MTSESLMKYGRYEVIKELGKGSMGVVYKALDPQIERLVALKVLRPDRVTSDAFVQRFLKEAKAIGRLSHPNIVTVYDAGQDHGTIYIAMEFLEGELLNQAVEKRRLGLRESINLGVQVAETLDYAHKKGIVHRDIKPTNIIVGAGGQVKITDFGIARIEDPSRPEQTQAGEILGTPAYMSPEQVLSRPVDGRSDLFSLGIILYELSTGQRPFKGENLSAIFNAITQQNPTPPAKLNPAVPEKLSQVVMKCLDKTPEKRFETGVALAEALKRSIREDVSAPVKATSFPKKSKRLLFLILSVLVLAGIFGGLYSYLATSRSGPPPVGKEVRSNLLKVESLPGGAQVFVDNMFRGTAPIELSLPIGKHEVRLALPNYHDWEAQVQLKDEGETPLRVRLIPVDEKRP
jgi:eukaryotic-like serine/threonine-protein kinase